MTPQRLSIIATIPRGGGGVLPSDRLMGMYRWMGSHFHRWIDYNGVAFLSELLGSNRTFLGFEGSEKSSR